MADGKKVSLKKILRRYFSIYAIFTISLIRAIKIKSQIIVESEINLGNHWNFLYKICQLNNEYLISAEGKKLYLYSISNVGIESFEIQSLETKLKLDKNESIIYSVFNNRNLKNYLLIDLFTKKILNFFSLLNIEKQYFKDCIKTLKINLKNINYTAGFENYTFNYRYEGAIQYFKNNKSKSQIIGFKNSKIAFLKSENKSNLFKNTNKKPKRVMIFYLDNLSFSTVEIIKKNKIFFPNLSSLFLDEKFITFKNSMSISNWTYPAAISFLTGIRFEKHKKYFPQEKNYISLMRKIYNSPNSKGLKNIYTNYKLRFRSGTNWRMKQHHGLHSFFTHCLSNPKMADIYSVLGQSLKQLDIAESHPSFHWIDIMDTHHPVKNSILPKGSLYLENKTIKQGLNFENGSKYNYGEHVHSTVDIYLSQIKSIDNSIGLILNHSFKKIPQEDHLISFISDHGTHVLNDGSNFSKNNELYNPLISFIPSKNNFQYFKDASEFAFSPANFLGIINNSLSQNKSLHQYEKSCLKFPYAQEIYPNKPYRLLIKYSKSEIFIYESNKLIPKKIVRNEKKFDTILKDCLVKGNWWLIKKNNKNARIKENELPKEIKNLLNFLISFKS